MPRRFQVARVLKYSAAASACRTHKKRSAGIDYRTSQKEFPLQNMFIDNELSDGRRETRNWAIASERRSRYALREIISKAAWAMSGCGRSGHELPFCQAATFPASRTVWLVRLGSDSELPLQHRSPQRIRKMEVTSLSEARVPYRLRNRFETCGLFCFESSICTFI